MDALLRYNATSANGDNANTANAYVQRNADKSINVGAVNASGGFTGTGMALARLAVSASQVISTAYAGYEVNATSAAVTLTLPPVATVAPGQAFELVKTDGSANAAGFQANAGETINGSSGVQSTTTQYAVLRVRANAAATAWFLG